MGYILLWLKVSGKVDFKIVTEKKWTGIKKWAKTSALQFCIFQGQMGQCINTDIQNKKMIIKG